MKWKQTAAVLAAGTLTLATAVSALAEAPQTIAQTSKDDVLSLPVQILDFNKDNLFFEYDNLDNGHMNFVSAENPPLSGNNVAYAEGLAATSLVGTLTYTAETQTRIAKIVADEVAANSDKHAADTIFGKVAANMTTGKKIALTDLLGESSDNWNKDGGWTYSPDAPVGKKYLWSDSSYVELPQDADSYKALWYFDGDHLVIPAGSNGALQHTFAVTPDTQYYLWSWDMANSEHAHYTKADIYDADTGDKIDSVELFGAAKRTFNTLENTQKIRIVLSSTSTTEDSLICALFLNTDETETTAAKYFVTRDGVDDRTLWTDTDNNGYVNNRTLTYYNGKNLLTRKENGVYFADTSASLTRVFDVNPNSDCTLTFWSPDANPVMLYDSTGTAISATSSSETPSHTLAFTAPADGKVHIKVQVSNAANKVAAMTLTSNPIVRVGSDVGNIRTFEDWNDLLTASDLTAREYTAFMLSHLFIPTAGLNTKVPEYENLILRRQNDGSYLFDSTQPITYDTENKMLYNTNAENGGEDRGGFFPLDNLGLKETTSTQFDEEPHTRHNYHFTLRSGGTFVYRDGLYFDFSGDDDVYLFINNQLVLDLGGAHLKASKRVDLDDLKASMGLEKGKTYNFDFFYMERHTDDSNLRIRTNIDVQRRIDDDSARVYQNIVFDLRGLANPPEELYVQAYRDGEIYDAPMKFTPDALARRLELEGGHDYTFVLLHRDTVTDKYELAITGETLTVSDTNGQTRTLTYTLREKGKDEPKHTDPVDPGKPDQPEQPTTATVVTPASDVIPAAPAPTTQAAVQAASAIPQTEDASHPVLLCLLCVVSAFGFGVVLVKRYMQQ